jgi:signal transduction histidine kinase/ligand-binding sensor domain-containing protein
LALLGILAFSLSGERLPVKSYGTSDGLPSERVQHIAQDSRGFLWFSTADGLSRFDGYEFTNYGVTQGLPNPIVNAFLEARDGSYWVATYKSVSRLRLTPQGPSFEIAAPTSPVSLPFIPSTLFQDSRGGLWCGVGSHGLFRIEQSPGARGWTLRQIDMKVPPPFGVISLVEDRRERGVLWAGTNLGLYRRWPDGTVDKVEGIGGFVEALIQDRNGRIWAGTRAGLFSFIPAHDTTPVSLRVYKEADGMANGDVKALLETSDGHIWAGCLIHGVTELTPAQDGSYTLRTYGRAQGLNDETVIALAEDRDGNLWAGGESGGAMKIVHRGFTTFTRADGLGADRISAMFEDRAGELYVSTGVGGPGNQLNRWNGRTFQSLSLHVDQAASALRQVALQDRTGEWWTARGDRLYRLGKRSFEQLSSALPTAVYATTAGLPGRYLLHIFEDSRGGIWASTYGALIRWDRETESLQDLGRTNGPPEQLVSAFADDRAGNIWLGLGGDGEGVVRYRNGRFREYHPSDGVPAGYVSALYVDHAGRLWIASAYGGLGRVDSPDALRPSFVSYTTAHGLSSNSVFSIAEDRWGRIYAGTRRGVDRLDVASGRINRFTVADGLPRGSVSTAFPDRHGDLWFGTAQGLARLSPELEADSPLPPVYISGLQAGSHQHLASASEHALELEPNENFLQVHFSALTFAAGEQLRYQYRLEGSSRDWSSPSEERTVVFSSLPSGKHRFLVRAVNGAGQVSPAPAVVAFSVLPRMTERLWFRLLVALLIGSAIYALYRYRIAQLLAVERIRMRIATDLHDDVGASLSQIAVLSDVLRRRSGRDDPGEFEPLHRIAGISRELVDSMSDIVWAISPQKDRLVDLTRRMRQFAEGMLVALGIEFTFEAPGRGEEIKLNLETRRQVFLIFKESVNNLVRHAGCTRVRVRLALEGDSLSLVVEDNGKGISNGDSDGHGILSMRSRATELGGSLEVRAGDYGGAAVVLRVPARARRGLRGA